MRRRWNDLRAAVHGCKSSIVENSGQASCDQLDDSLANVSWTMSLAACENEGVADFSPHKEVCHSEVQRAAFCSQNVSLCRSSQLACFDMFCEDGLQLAGAFSATLSVLLFWSLPKQIRKLFSPVVHCQVMKYQNISVFGLASLTSRPCRVNPCSAFDILM